MRRRQDRHLASARAYYRLAAKAERAGNYRQAEHYRGVAERKVAQSREARAFAERLRRAQDR